jgi:hypothetical protein
LESLIRVLNRQSLSKTPVFLNDFKEVKYIGNAGVGPGVARDFFTACIKQCEEELFQQVEGSDLYDIRNDLDLNNNDIKRKLKVLGFLIGIMVCNELTFSFKVKRALIHMCLYSKPPKDDPSFLVYHILEDPEATISLINLMKNPKDIEYSYLDFEDVGKPKQLVTVSNYQEFLLAKEEYSIPEAYKLVAQGFVLAGFDKLFVTMGNSVASLHKALCMTEITEEVRKEFVKQIDFGSMSDSVKKWFTDIILTIEPDFLRKLIHFWSASYGITKDKTYQVVEGKRVITKKVCPLVESHTCYYQLVLPQGIESKDKLLEILQTSVGNVSKGVALYGGKTTSKEYLTHKNRRYVVHKGSRGGKYIINKGEKKYLKQIL